MSDGWKNDDAAIDGKTAFLRMIPARPEYTIARDCINGRPYATPRALQIDVNSGLSVHGVDLLLSEHSVEPADYYPTEYLIEFTASTVRQCEDWGVILEPEPDDEAYGKAHALVRHATPKPSKSKKEQIREAINRDCVWIREPDAPRLERETHDS